MPGQRPLYLLIVAAVAALFWIADHEPQFFMGDSGTYILTAVQGYIPPERSFVYGFLIKSIALPFHSLKPLLMIQGLAGILGSILMAICLKRYGPEYTGDRICFLIAFLFSIEPLHLMLQRFVLTEAFTMPLLIGYIGAVFSYFKNNRLSKLLIIQLLGLGLITMRLIFLPLVLLNSFLVPLIPFLSATKDTKKIFQGLAVSLISVFIFHGGYCLLNGALSQAPPAYSYWDGFFQVSAWAPAVTVESAANTQVAEIIRKGPEYDLQNFNRRIDQLWLDGALVARIRKAAPDLYTANRWAKITARRAFIQDPVGVLKIGFQTYADFNSYRQISAELIIGRGDDIPLTENLLSRLKYYFSSDRNEFDMRAGEYWQKASLTKRIQDHSELWFLLLIQTPYLCLLAGFFIKRCRMHCFFLSFVSFIYLATVCFLTPVVVVRLLYPLTVPFFLCAGWCLSVRSKPVT